MIIGLVAGIAAGALWGLTFLAPEVLPPGSAAHLTLLRYLVFGLSSLAVLAVLPGAAWRPLARRHWKRLIWLGLAGNSLYYLLLTLAIERTGAVIVTMIIGTLPVVMAVAGGALRPGFRPSRFVAPGLLILGGIALKLAADGAFAALSSLDVSLAGLALAIAALASWAVYGVANAEILAREEKASAAAWTALTGVATLASVLPLALLLLPAAGPDLAMGVDLGRLALWALLLGLVSSWLATLFWTLASARLGVEMLGYLIVSETVFGIGYALAAAGRLPSGLEMLAILALLAGVALGIRAARKANAGLKP